MTGSIITAANSFACCLTVPPIDKLAVIKDQNLVTEINDSREIVTYEYYCKAAADLLFHPFEAPSLKLCVTDTKNLIHEQDLRIQMRRNRKGEADVHTA
jgi:hypothetical protein